MIQLFFIICVE
ncbi:hypothetical protein COA28_21115 [Bacillus cereus]|nr:hypothetical protein CN298_22360 [Bacillus cereus]PGQ92586.1 hypothetical protein COA28_21115 [Bacillus cereus]